jgi:hypothetical protein
MTCRYPTVYDFILPPKNSFFFSLWSSFLTKSWMQLLQSEMIIRPTTNIKKQQIMLTNVSTLATKLEFFIPDDSTFAWSFSPSINPSCFLSENYTLKTCKMVSGLRALKLINFLNSSRYISVLLGIGVV